MMKIFMCKYLTHFGSSVKKETTFLRSLPPDVAWNAFEAFQDPFHLQNQIAMELLQSLLATYKW